jgi:hypothetical protein
MAAASLFSQVQTVITGKVFSKPDKPVILLVYGFNTSTMKEEVAVVHTNIGADSSFTLSTDKVTQPLTACRLGFNNEGQKIILSPGDTLHTEFQYGAMDSTMTFSGTRAGINEYLKTYQLIFREKYKEEYFENLSQDYSALIDSLTAWKDKKISLLISFYDQGKVDGEFLEHEKARIRYDYFNDLVPRGNVSYPGDSVYRNRVDWIFATGKISDDHSLVEYKEYRNFLVDYMDFRVRQSTGKQVGIQDYLNRVKMELSGLSRTFCSYYYISNLIDGVRNGQEKILLRDYFKKISDDEALIGLLTSKDMSYTYTNRRDTSTILRSAWSFFLSILIYAIIGFAVFKVLTIRNKRGRRINPLYVIQGVVLLLALVYLGNYVAIYRNSGHLALPVGRVLTWGLFAGFQAFYLIPAWFKKGRYLGYGLLLLLISSIYFVVLFVIAYSEYDFHSFSQLVHHRTMIQIVNSWLILVPVSFLVYYVNLLARRGQSISYLFRQHLVSLEVIANVLIMFLFISTFLTRYIRNQSGHDELIIFFMGSMVFYVHAMFLIPKYMLKERVGKYLIGVLVVFIATTIVFYIENIIGVYRSLGHVGVKIPFIEVIQLPEQMVTKTAFSVQLMIVPALIYALIKHQLSQRTVGFQLFRNKEAELQQLRSQVNPHFLFNSLNTVYAFALKENNPKTAEYIAKLANLMRYLVDDMEKERIPVQKEISYIRDYINLQAIRSSVEHRIEINDLIGEEQNILIAPMLMIPFVENAFKHGINPNQVSELKVTFQIREGKFQFVIENSVDPHFEAFYKEKGFGIGIPNVRQRLEHIYPGMHTLSVANTGGRFIVILSIDIHPLEQEGK